MMSDDYGMITGSIIHSKEAILLEKVNPVLNLVNRWVDQIRCGSNLRCSLPFSTGWSLFELTNVEQSGNGDTQSHMLYSSSCSITELGCS
jgi:hypothetical protein